MTSAPRTTHRPSLSDAIDARTSPGPQHLPSRPSRARHRAVVGGALLAGLAATVVGLWTPPGTGTSTLAPPAAPLQEDDGGLVSSGVEKGFIVGIGQASDGGATVVVNRAIVLSGEEAAAESERRGLEPPPNDVLLVDDDMRLREYAVRADARVTLTVGLSPADAPGEVESSLAELQELLRPAAGGPGEVRGGHLFDLVVADGVVIELRHVYLV